MICNRVTSENLIERYLKGTLDPDLRDEFENHYFECETCLAMLQTVQTIQPVLAAMPPPAIAKRPARLLAWIGLAAAATVAVVLLTWPKADSNRVVALPPAAETAPGALLLSEIQPAPYAPVLFRDGSASAGPSFAAAMGLYQEGRWESAAQALVKATPATPAAVHFSGVSFLLAGQTAAAMAALDKVIALGSNSPFEEEARFYRGQALLLTGRVPEARQELERVVQGRGDYEARARSLLSRF